MNIQLLRNFKEKLSQQAVIGPFSKTQDAALIEIMGHAGFDFVIVDLEHGPNHILSLQNLIRAAELSGIIPVVRVKENMPSLIGEVLDAGAWGIQIPQITCAEEARAVLEYAKFHPEGMRGVCRYVRAAGYSSLDRFQYFKEANETLIILQIEGEKAIGNIDEILGVQGIDVIFIGPYDLSQSLGVPGQVAHPLVTRKMEEIIEKCSKYNKSVGTFVETTGDAKRWMELGVRYVSFSVDMGIFYNACNGIIQDISL